RHDLVLELVWLLPGRGVLLVHEADDHVAVRLDRAVREEALVTGAGRPDRPLVRRAVGRVRARDLDRARLVLAGVVGVREVDRRAQERALAELDPVPAQV